MIKVNIRLPSGSPNENRHPCGVCFYLVFLFRRGTAQKAAKRYVSITEYVLTARPVRHNKRGCISQPLRCLFSKHAGD